MADKVISKSALHETHKKWAERLKKIDLNQLKRVCTFAKGTYAHVSLVQLEGHSDSAFALKAIRKDKSKEVVARNNILIEKDVLSKVQSDFVLKLYKTYKDKKRLYFLTEYCPGGNLYNRGPVTQKIARFYLACVVEALDALHSLDFVHNDIKPTNLVLDADGYVKLIDMGLCEKIERGKLSSSTRGGILFMSPEICGRLLKKPERIKGHDRAVDLWALGVMLYYLLTNKTPFKDKLGRVEECCLNIKKGIDAAHFSKRYFSEGAKDLIRKLCAYDPQKRLGYENIQEIRTHGWFEKFDWVKLRNRELKPPLQHKVESAIDTQHFKLEVTSDSDGLEDESDWAMEF